MPSVAVSVWAKRETIRGKVADITESNAVADAR
jgi:hypothetical protein